jgi:hypothetical protein
MARRSAGDDLDSGRTPPTSTPSDGACGERGLIEEQNLIIEYRPAGGRGERFAELATELVQMKVDVIVTRGR